MTREEFQQMVVDYLGEKPVFRAIGKRPSFSGWTMETYGEWLVTEKAIQRARRLSDSLECALHTVYRYAAGVAAPTYLMYDPVKKAIEQCISEESSSTKCT